MWGEEGGILSPTGGEESSGGRRKGGVLSQGGQILCPTKGKQLSGKGWVEDVMMLKEGGGGALLMGGWGVVCWGTARAAKGAVGWGCGGASWVPVAS